MSDSIREEEEGICSSPIPDQTSQENDNVSGAMLYPRPADYDTWMPCKKQSWDQLQTNPNGFFYRHVLPGETKKNGPWSENEKKLFIEHLRKEPVGNTHWGLFARNIPGRVGYQCNAFYKKLILSGELQALAPDIPIPEIKQREDGGEKVVTPRKRKLKLSDDEPEFRIPDCDQFACDYPLETSNLSAYIPKTAVKANEFREKLIDTLAAENWKNRFVSTTKIYY